MTIMGLPWLELAILTAVIGSLVVGLMRIPRRAAAWGMGFMGGVFVFAFLAWLSFSLGGTAAPSLGAVIQERWLGRVVFRLDELSAPMVPSLALLHFLTGVATARSRMRHFSYSWSLGSEAIRLAMFSCVASWTLVALLVLCTLPPYFELVNRGRPTRVYVLHLTLFNALLIVGWSLVEMRGRDGGNLGWELLPLMMAILVRCGTVPAHCWVTDWFEHASFGNALLFVAPLVGVYAAARLVLPIAPEWVLRGIGIASLVTAVYAAAMATIQRDTRRLFAFLFLSHASLVLVGLELFTELSLTASLCVWFSVILSLGGFGLTLRALESRCGRLSLAEFHGLYSQAPSLAVCYLLTGLGCVGFPGTLGFISTELLVDSAVEYSPWVGVAVVGAGALNGIAVLRGYFSLFTGVRHAASISLRIVPRERFAVLTLSALILGGGLFPQPGVLTRYRATLALLAERRQRMRAVAPGVAERPRGTGLEQRGGGGGLLGAAAGATVRGS